LSCLTTSRLNGEAAGTTNTLYLLMAAPAWSGSGWRSVTVAYMTAPITMRAFGSPCCADALRQADERRLPPLLS
jgi:hypothetical protein